MQQTSQHVEHYQHVHSAAASVCSKHVKGGGKKQMQQLTCCMIFGCSASWLSKCECISSRRDAYLLHDLRIERQLMS
jgi:hypothetical protein